jgi:adenylate kinase
LPELNLILLGPPGSGKGTQGKTLQEDFHLPYYATGDILRAAVKEGTEVIIEVIGELVQQEEASDGFILDGFPRTVPQAEALDEEMDDLGRRITAAILIDVPEEEIIRRLSGRRTCEGEGHIFHVDFDPPKEDGVCDIDGSKLIVRDDDKPEVIRHRLGQYREKTEPLIDYYDQREILCRVDGNQPPEEVSERIHALLATLRMEEEI